MRRTVAGVIGLVVCVGRLFVPAVASSRYTYTRIADTKGELRYLSEPALNNRGDVVFVATFWGGGRAIVTGNERALTIIADTRTGPFNEFVNVGSINERGQVAFGSYREGDGGADVVWLWDAGRLRTIADTTDGRFLYARGSPIVNNSGAVAFWVRLVDTTDAIMIWERGTLRQAVNTAGEFATVDAAPAFTNTGELAFKAQGAGTSLNAIVLVDGHGTRIVADDTGRFQAFSDAPGLNAAGAVVFHANQEGAPSVIELATAHGTIDLAADNGAYRSVFRPTINAAGTIAFKGSPAVAASRGSLPVPIRSGIA